jgi:hypothetical protein
MLKKMMLGLALLVTAGNLAAGVVYASVCKDSAGSRYCGNTCVTKPGGGCECQGACSGDELNWVSGAHVAEAAAMEELAY